MAFKIHDDVGTSIKKYLPQVLAAFSVTILAISDGMTFAWTSPMLLYLTSEESHIKTTKEQVEWLETTFLYGCLCGIPVTLYSVDKFGRKMSLTIVSVMMLIGWLIIALANNMIYLFISRFLAGMASNMVYVACPMYTSEISDENIRGFLSGMMLVMDHAGSLISYCLGPYTPFYVAPIFGSVVVIIQIIIFRFIPDSPFYLLVNDRIAEARRALVYFKPYKNPEEEMKAITDMLEKEKSEGGGIRDLFATATNRKIFAIITILNIAPQLLGYTVIVMNLHVILESAESIYMDSSSAAILSGGIMLAATIVCATTVDRFGRRLLLIVSSIISGVCILMLAIYFNLQASSFDTVSISWIPMFSVMLFCLFFKIGAGIVPLIVNAEISPATTRAVTVTYGDGLKIVGSVIAVQIYQFVTKASGLYLTFYIYFCSAIILTLFTILYVPETKGHSLEEIQQILKEDKKITRYL